MKQKLKILILIILIIAAIAGIGFLIVNAVRSISYNESAQNPVVTLEIEGYGEVQIELYPDYAPNTVKQIVYLVNSGYYDGKIFYGTDGIAVSAGMTLESDEEETTDETEEITDDTTDETEETTDDTTDEDTEEESTEPTEDILMASYYDSSIESDSDDDYEVSIEGEFVANDYADNTLRFEYGTVRII